MTSTTTPRAPWHDLFNSHLTQNSSSEFTLATTAYDVSRNHSVPRARTCGFRGFFPNPELHPSAVDALKSQGDGLNPDIYESDMISFTTDVRMEKVAQIQPSSRSGEEKAFAGNQVELVFWLKDVMKQWRIRGSAFVIGNSDGSVGEREARKKIQRGMRVRPEGHGHEKEWTWERQVTTYFANHSPVMRGLFLIYSICLCCWALILTPFRYIQKPSTRPTQIANSPRSISQGRAESRRPSRRCFSKEFPSSGCLSRRGRAVGSFRL